MINPLLLTDYYKTEHHKMYPKGTIMIYSNLTPRKSRIPGIDKVVVFGIQHFIKEYLIEKFQKDFFDRPLDEIIKEYKFAINIDTTHIEELHNLGYLPIEIKALPEGTLCPIRVPLLTIRNTHPKFFWLTNYLETLMSCQLWQPITSATIAHQYRQILDKYAIETAGSIIGVQWQGHDFSMRGMNSVESAILSGMGHLLSFTGTDTIPAIYALKKSYNAFGLIGASVPATEHSVMCMGTKDDEIGTFKSLLQKYPSGILSVVSDTWDLWKVCTEYLPQLKEDILTRDGKLVIRPDSGDPVDIICGKFPEEGDFDWIGKSYEEAVRDRYINKKWCSKNEYKGVIELLWDVFGGTINELGYKVLDPHIGAIYGDSITMERAIQICERLKEKGFASTNVVFGIGSFTYQYNTRDTFGFAVKATYGEIRRDCICKDFRPNTDTPKDQQIPWGSCQWDDGELFCSDVGRCNNDDFVEAREIFKDPITDDGTKKSAKGLLKVVKTLEINQLNNRTKHIGYELLDQQSWEEEKQGELKTVFLDGKLIREQNLEEIRGRLNDYV